MYVIELVRRTYTKGAKCPLRPPNRTRCSNRLKHEVDSIPSLDVWFSDEGPLSRAFDATSNNPNKIYVLTTEHEASASKLFPGFIDSYDVCNQRIYLDLKST